MGARQRGVGRYWGEGSIEQAHSCETAIQMLLYYPFVRGMSSGPGRTCFVRIAVSSRDATASTREDNRK